MDTTGSNDNLPFQCQLVAYEAVTTTLKCHHVAYEAITTVNGDLRDVKSQTLQEPLAGKRRTCQIFVT